MACKPPVLPVALRQILNVLVCHHWLPPLYNDIWPDDIKSKKLKFNIIFHDVVFLISVRTVWEAPFNIYWEDRKGRKSIKTAASVSVSVIGQPAESPSVGGDVDAAVRRVSGDGHKLVDESCPSHQSEGADQLAMISDHTQNVACIRDG